MSKAQKTIRIIESLFSLHEGFPIRDIPFREIDDRGTISFVHDETIGGSRYNFQLELFINSRILTVGFSKDGLFSRQPHIQTSQSGTKEMIRAASVVRSMLVKILNGPHGHKISYIRFTASGEDNARIRLYDRFTKELARSLGGRSSATHDGRDAIFTVLLKGTKPSGTTKQLVLPPRAGERRRRTTSPYEVSEPRITGDTDDALRSQQVLDGMREYIYRDLVRNDFTNVMVNLSASGTDSINVQIFGELNPDQIYMSDEEIKSRVGSLILKNILGSVMRSQGFTRMGANAFKYQAVVRPGSTSFLRYLHGYTAS
jgi:hypothetical protein